MTQDERDKAETRSREARKRLLATLGEVHDRLRPSSLAQDAMESAASGVASVAKRGAKAVRKRPVALAAVAGTIGLVMARGWIADIVGNHRLKGQEPGDPPSAPPPTEPKRAGRAARTKKEASK